MWDPHVGRDAFFWKLGENVSQVSPLASDSLLVILGFSWFVTHHRDLCLYLHMMFFCVHESLSKIPPFKRTPAILDKGPSSKTSSYLVLFAAIVFPSKVIFWDSGVKTSTYEFWGDTAEPILCFNLYKCREYRLESQHGRKLRYKQHTGQWG